MVTCFYLQRANLLDTIWAQVGKFWNSSYSTMSGEPKCNKIIWCDQLCPRSWWTKWNLDSWISSEKRQSRSSTFWKLPWQNQMSDLKKFWDHQLICWIIQHLWLRIQVFEKIQDLQGSKMVQPNCIYYTYFSTFDSLWYTNPSCYVIIAISFGIYFVRVDCAFPCKCNWAEVLVNQDLVIL